MPCPENRPALSAPPCHPHEFPRRVLLCVTGMAPQVVTETLYALLSRERPFVPTEVHLLTTRRGAERAELSLLEPDTDWFGKLLDDFGVPRATVDFDRDHIHVVRGHDARALEDIRDVAENTAAADRITRFVLRLSADDRCAIHASLAGGRKTLGYYLGYAMSLFGRPQDVLSHVLVRAPFEYLPSFFYPPKHGLVLHLDDGTPVHTRDATIELAEIPFVRLAGGLKKPLNQRLQDPDFSFRSAVEEAQLALEPPLLRIERGDNLVLIGERRLALKLARTDFVFYALVAEWAKSGRAVQRKRLPGEQLLALADRCGVEFRSAGTAPDFDATWFDQRKTHINETLQLAGLPADSAYHLQSVRRGYFGLGVPPKRIEIVDSGV